MIKNAGRVCCVVGLILISQSAWADLTSPIYKKAKDAYERDDCKSAVHLLEEYQHKYRSFLKKHAEIKNDIDRAITYCNKYTERWTRFTGEAHGVDKKAKIKRGLSPKPNLP